MTVKQAQAILRAHYPEATVGKWGGLFALKVSPHGSVVGSFELTRGEAWKLAAEVVLERKGKPMTPEGAILRAVLDYLAATRVFAIRMNTGTLRNPRGQPISFGVPGMADVLAFPVWHDCGKAKMGSVFWIEVKADKGKQSDLQKSFQAQVEAEGHRYAVVHSVEELIAVLETGAARKRA